MNPVIRSYNKIKEYPFGKAIFSYMVSRRAPYFKGIRPRIEELRPNFIKVNMRKRKAIHNHIQTVHAIAMCNLCEYAMGICAEASIPKHRRWIPMGMEVAYLKKATTNLTATCDLSDADWSQSDVPCFVSVKDTKGVEVMTATIKLRVTDKPPKK